MLDVPASIRERALDDAAAVIELMRTTHQGDGYPRYLPEDLSAFACDPRELAAWVAEEDGSVVGHVALHPGAGDPAAAVAGPALGLAPERTAVVARLMVQPGSRRRGVARQLLNAAADHARAHRLRLVLDVLETSLPARALYEQLGWTLVGPLLLPVHGHGQLRLAVYLSPENAASSEA